ncbi:hypothetical protein SAMN04515674_11226 [Pseudarcicella hirudinis]|uniref:Uncharacterized protein n=2 Tax=Pseudarcicella hirudinis TaxID=1079859 RepID=A0A1I5WKU2_9BACT|nr:hypothetical protein SAMN04515674_11226 [Pseudarcicella hirudinis]
MVLILLLLISNTASFAQCAMCRATVESTMSNGRNLAATGLNTGILYLLSAPYLIVAGVAFLWYRNSKKEVKRRENMNLVQRRLNQVLGRI